MEELFGGVGGGGGGVKVSLSGNNTLGVKTLISTGTMYVAGGSNITVSQSQNSLTIIGETNSGATTFLAGAGSLGNTLGTTGLVNNQMYFVGGNNITLSQSTNAQSATLTISAPNLPTAISSIAADGTTYSSGQVVFVGSNAASVNSSAAGQTLIIDVPVQTVQPEGTVLFGVSSGGNTLGSTGMASGTGPRLVFVGGNNITLSQSLDAGSVSGTITISGPNIGGAQTGISSIVASDATYTSGQVIFVGTNAATVLSGANQSVIIDVPVHSNQTAISGISASDTVYTSGTVDFVGSGIVTVKSGPGQQVIIDASGGGGAFTGGVSSGGNTAGTTGTVSNGILFVGGTNVTLQQSSGAGGATITVSGAEQRFSAGVSSGGNTLGTTGTVSNQLVLVGGTNITLSQSINASGNATVTISGATGAGVALSGAGNTSGTMTLLSTGTVVFAGGNNITLSQDGSVITISGAEGGGAGISTFGNTAGTTGIAGQQLILVGGSNVSLSQSIDAGSSNATITINISTAPGFGAGMGSSGNTAGTIGTVNAELYFVGGSNITLSQSINGQSATITFDGVSGGTGAGFTAGVSSEGNTSGTTGLVPGQIVFVGGSNVTLSQSINASSATITIIGESGATGGGFTAGVSSLGNTSGSTGLVPSEIVFVGGNNVTLSQSINASSATITISGPSGGGAGMGTGTNTSGTSGSVGKELFFYGNSNIGLSQSVNGSSASLTIVGNAGGGGIAASLSGNSTSGGGGYVLVSSGTLILAGGNNVTLSQDGQSVTISGANLGGAQTGISSIANSETTYTSGAVSFLGSGIVTVKSGTGQALYFDATVAAQTAQTGISSISVSDTVYTSGGISFVGSNLVTVRSSAGQAVVIDASFSQTVPPAESGNVVSASGNTSGTLETFTSGTIVLAGGNNITLSQSSNSITISGPTTAAQSVQTYNVVSASGNTAGTLETFSTGTVVFAGGNNITLSQSSNSITISGANVGGAQTGISSIAASDTTYTSGQVVFTGTNNITVVSGTGQRVIISGPTGGGAGMSTLGNTAGTTGTVGKELVLVGGANITLSQSVNGSSATLTIVGASGGGGGIAASLSGNSTSGGGGYSLVSSGTLYLAGGNNVTLSQDGVSVTISGANVGGAQTGISGLGANGTVFTSGTVIFSDSNNVSFGTSGTGTQQTITASASFNQTVQPEGVVTVGMSNLGNTSGTSGVVNGSNLQYFFAGGNNVTLSQSIDGSSATLTISGVNTVAQTAQTGISGIAGSGASTATSGTVQFANSNGVTFGLNGNTITASHNGITSQSNQVITVYATSNTLSVSSGTFNASSMLMRGIDQLSVGFSNGSLLFEAGAADAGSQSIGISNLGNTSGTSGIASGSAIQYYFAGGNNVTLSQSVNGASGTVTVSAISVPSSSAIAQAVSNVSSAGTLSARYALADHAHVGVAGLNVSGTASTFVGNVMLSVTNLTLVTGGNSSAGSIGISAAAPGGGGAALGMGATGNTAGNTFSSSTGTVYFQGTNNITVSGSTAAGSLNTIWISGPTGGGAGMGTGTNTSGTSGTVGKQLYLYGNSNVGLSQSVDGSSASLTIVGNAGAGGATVSEWMPPGVGYSSFTQMGQSSLVMFQVAPPYYVTASRADMFASISVSTSSNSSHNGYVSLYMGVYTKNASTLSLASSGSAAKSWNVTGSTSSGSVVGWRDLTLPIDVNMTPGRYWVGVISVTNTTNANWFTASNMGLIAVPAQYSGPLGGTAASNQYQLGNGVFSAQTAALPASVAFSDIVANGASTGRPIVNFVNQTV